MYEEFIHPNRLDRQEEVQALLAAREAIIIQRLIDAGIPVTPLRVARILLPYKRKLRRKYRNELNIGGLYVYAVRPIAFLDVEVPNILPWDTKFSGEYSELEIKRTMREYLVRYKESIDGTKVLFSLAGKPDGQARSKPVTARELGRWKTFLEARGFNWDNVLTAKQWRTRVLSPAYFTLP